MGLLTETADYDEPGSWGRVSEGWPGIKGPEAYDMYCFANCIRSAPYGSYVLMAQEGHYKATESYLRVHADHIDKLKADFEAAGRPKPAASAAVREKYGRLNETGNREAAPEWKEI